MSNLIFEKMQQTLAAAQVWPMMIGGNFLRISEAQWPITLRLYSAGRVIGSMSNMLAGDYVRDVEFDEFEIINGATAQNVTLQISGGGAGSDRVLGEVSVINGELNRVKAGQCFMGFGYINALAGNYSIIQLWNPVGSGKNLILNKASAYSSSGATMFAKHNVSVGTNTGFITNKNLSGAAGVGIINTLNSVSQVGSIFSLVGLPTAGDSKEFQFSEPIIINPGYGIVMESGNLAITVYSTYQWNEETI